jgi:tetraacyldisaccharide 4'-kinase
MNHREPLGMRFFPCLLYGVSIMYGGGIKVRQRWYNQGCLQERSLGVPVISIGNLTVGGTGKTPMTRYLAGKLYSLGRRPAILSRGYGGTAQGTGGVVGDGNRLLMTALAAGDEPVLLASQLAGIPVLVGKDRYRSGKKSVMEFGADVVILDDGFQYMGLRKDINLLLLDHRAPLGNGFLIPRGRLREEPEAGKRADAVIWTHFDNVRGTGGPEDRFSFMPRAFFKTRPIFYHETTLSPNKQPDGISGSHDKVVAFSGIAGNEDFFRELSATGVVVEHLGFPDHHAYTKDDLSTIVDLVSSSGAGGLATTGKDRVRLPLDFDWPVPLKVYDVKPEFIGGDGSFIRFIREALARWEADYGKKV